MRRRYPGRVSIDSANTGLNGYCGTTADYGAGYNLMSFFVVWLGSDFWEFLYHSVGHSYPSMWAWHKHHHVFFNPSPFSVVADEFVDQFFRALPLVVFPMIMSEGRSPKCYLVAKRKRPKV